MTQARGISFSRLLDYPLVRCPDKTALIDDHGSLTFAETHRMASRLRRALLGRGVRPGNRVAVILPNCNAFVVAEIAVIKGGMVKVPLNIRFHADEVLYALKDCGPTALICDPSYAKTIQAKRSEIESLKMIVVVGEDVAGCDRYERIVDGGDLDPSSERIREDNPILIRYTGGTTGRPKGIVHTESSLLAINLDVIREFGLGEADVVLQLGHLAHGLNFIWTAVYAAGATQVLRERFEPKHVLGDIERHRVTFVYMVPTMVQRLLREDDGTADVSSLRTFMYSSAPMPVPLLRQAIERYGNIFTQVYTLSEAPVITTIFHPHEHLDKETLAGTRLGSCGREVITMEIKLIGDDGDEAAAGEPGEICVRSFNNMAEYWGLPEETSETVVDGWVRTGDVARRDEEGFLYIVDRKKDVIITGAFNVYPKEVEDVLYRHSAVLSAAVVGVPDPEWGEAIKAYVVLRPGAQCSADELVQLCRNHLASYKKPRAIEFVDNLPLSPVGKIIRRALRSTT